MAKNARELMIELVQARQNGASEADLAAIVRVNAYLIKDDSFFAETVATNEIKSTFSGVDPNKDKILYDALVDIGNAKTKDAFNEKFADVFFDPNQTYNNGLNTNGLNTSQVLWESLQISGGDPEKAKDYFNTIMTGIDNNLDLAGEGAYAERQGSEENIKGLSSILNKIPKEHLGTVLNMLHDSDFVSDAHLGEALKGVDPKTLGEITQSLDSKVLGELVRNGFDNETLGQVVREHDFSKETAPVTAPEQEAGKVVTPDLRTATLALVDGNATNDVEAIRDLAKAAEITLENLPTEQGKFLTTESSVEILQAINAVSADGKVDANEQAALKDLLQNAVNNDFVGAGQDVDSSLSATEVANLKDSVKGQISAEPGK